jgi:hypothetical protein
VLFFHEAKESQLPYEVPVPREESPSCPLSSSKHGDNFKSRSLQLAPGRYFIEIFSRPRGRKMT